MDADNFSRKVGITVLGSGSRGNATVIQKDGEALLIDAGFSARELRKRMKEAGVDERLLRGILVSHEHSDHVRGLRVLAGQLEIPIYANEATGHVLRNRDPKLGKLTIFAAGNPFAVGGFMIEPFSIPHDAYDPVAFVVCDGELRIGLATDLGHASAIVIHRLSACDALVVESNHDIGMLRNSDRKWSLKQRILSRHGHLSNADGLKLLEEILHERTQHVILAHASGECNDYNLIEKGAVRFFEEIERTDVGLHVARQEAHLPTIWIGA